MKHAVDGQNPTPSADTVEIPSTLFRSSSFFFAVIVFINTQVGCMWMPPRPCKQTKPRINSCNSAGTHFFGIFFPTWQITNTCHLSPSFLGKSWSSNKLTAPSVISDLQLQQWVLVGNQGWSEVNIVGFLLELRCVFDWYTNNPYRITNLRYHSFVDDFKLKACWDRQGLSKNRGLCYSRRTTAISTRKRLADQFLLMAHNKHDDNSYVTCHPFWFTCWFSWNVLRIFQKISEFFPLLCPTWWSCFTSTNATIEAHSIGRNSPCIHGIQKCQCPLPYTSFLTRSDCTLRRPMFIHVLMLFILLALFCLGVEVADLSTNILHSEMCVTLISFHSYQ